MKEPRESVSASGVSLLYEPDESHAAIVDIVFVHGLGGHPVRTWLYRDPLDPLSGKSPGGGSSLRGLLRKNSLPGRARSNPSKLALDIQPELLDGVNGELGRERRVLRKNSDLRRTNSRGTQAGKENFDQRGYHSHSTSKLRLLLDANVPPLVINGGQVGGGGTGNGGGGSGGADGVYWPLDLLPDSCRSTRILTWGCQTLSTNRKLLPAQNDVFANAEDLVRDLTTYRDETGTFNRAIIFVTHSTGGVIVKEALRLSESGESSHIKDLLHSTSAVVFLGCPHRATLHGSLGDAVTSMAGAMLDVDPQDAVLRDLSGTARVELHLGSDAFVRIWNDFNFKVKTYQEALGMPQKALDDLSLRRQTSFIGDVREKAESIGASHLDMCRFKSAHDPAYRSLAATLSKFVHDEMSRLRQLSHKEHQVCARLIAPPRLLLPRERSSIVSYPGTCLWLYDLPEFRGWHHRSDSSSRRKILWVRGRPGSGKSVLLRSLRARLEKQWAPLGSAAFISSTAHGERLDSVFFPRRRGRKSHHHLDHHHNHNDHLFQHETSPAAVYRNLLAQLFRQDPRLRKAVVTLCKGQNRSFGSTTGSNSRASRHRVSTGSTGSGQGSSWSSVATTTSSSAAAVLDDAQIVLFFADEYAGSPISTPTRRTFIFVDAADDCGPAYLHDLLHHLSLLAHNSDFSICVATAHHPDTDQLLLPPGAAVEVVMHLRNEDDITRFVSLSLVAEWEDRDQTVRRIARKSGGVFLWAEIVVGILNAAIGEGATQKLIDDTVLEMPGDLDGLYEWLLSTLNPEEKAEALALFQWAVLASAPMRLNDLRVAVCITKPWGAAEMRPDRALSLDPPASLRDLLQRRSPATTEAGPTTKPTDTAAAASSESGSFDSPYQFHRWVRSRSIGLLELRPESGDVDDRGPSNEPLGLQRVQVIHESVRSFFLSGRGFAALEKDNETTLYSHSFSSEDLADLSHYVLLNACLTYLNATDFECLGHTPSSNSTGLPLAPMPYDESKYWRRNNARDQRKLVISSYPFLQYAIDNLLFHLLSPRFFRFYLPQRDVLRLFAANRCRLWRRWTSLLGVGVSDPDGVLAICEVGPAGYLLDPVFGARFRVERVFRRVSKMAAAEMGLPSRPVPPMPQQEGSKAKGKGKAVEIVEPEREREKPRENRRTPPAPLSVRTIHHSIPRTIVTAADDAAPTIASATATARSRPPAAQEPSQLSPADSSRIVSFTSTDVPSVFSPTSPTSASTLLSPLSAFEASPMLAFEKYAFAAPKITAEGYAVI